jgi:hypothetical protein
MRTRMKMRMRERVSDKDDDNDDVFAVTDLVALFGGQMQGEI